MTKQAIDGIILVNKPQGLTSNAVLQRVKRLFNAKKAGHTGSLDPMATGMLPICFGEGTKFSQYLLDADKQYEVTGLLGVKTNTADAMGETIATCEQFSITLLQLQEVISEFLGDIKQVPSMFSALKHQGTPLYKYARAGINIERPAREITIRDMQLHSFDGKSFSLTVTCSKGTYIRNLVEDIGERLRVGAHVTKLHRVCTAGFSTDQMYTLECLADKNPTELMECILPMDRAVAQFPSIVFTDEEVTELRLGKQLEGVNIGTFEGTVRLYDTDNRLIGLGDLQTTGILKSKRLCRWE